MMSQDILGYFLVVKSYYVLNLAAREGFRATKKQLSYTPGNLLVVYVVPEATKNSLRSCKFPGGIYQTPWFAHR